ncbi:MAG TPA: FAD-dependent oxidoreductase, partial [Parachlamydiaceae bacterium]|nr:FAD-dependent oxidoreductase [Parachlamydiaceae bacterium]
MKIAIIGAGFAGLATAWHLLQHQDKIPLEVTIFDSSGFGGGASGIAAGLL